MDQQPQSALDNIRAIRKRAWLPVVVTIASLTSAALLTSRQVPQYEASALLFIGERQVSADELQQGVAISQLSRQLLETYAEVIRTTPITAAAIREGRLPSSPDGLAAALGANPVPNTQLLRLRYRHRDPDLARRTVNAVARVFVEEVERLETSSPQGDEPALNVSVVQPALTPSRPISPRPTQNLTLAGLLGLAIGAAGAILLEHLDTTIKHKDEVEARLGLPVLASVPQIRTRREELYVEGDNRSVFAETFRKLRTAIELYGADDPVGSVLVTSPHSGDGKTTTALNLAAVFAYAGNHTVLVEADLRRPALHRLFATEDLRGLATHLAGRTELDDALVRTDIHDLHVLPAAAIPPNPVELLGSARMQHLLTALRERFHIVVIDAPPLLPVADASTIAPRVDGVLVVARAKTTRRAHLSESVGLIESVRGRMLGVVLNAVAVGESGGYSYYQYDAQPQRKARRRRARSRS